MSRLAAWLLTVVIGCAGGPDAELEKAKGFLAKAAYPDALEAASAGLAAGAQGPVAWRLELAALEAEARSGQGSPGLARLQRLATERPEQVPASLYVQAAGQMRDGGDPVSAVSALDAGLKRFPGDVDLTKAIEQAKSTGSPAELENLRSLGYVQ